MGTGRANLACQGVTLNLSKVAEPLQPDILGEAAIFGVFGLNNFGVFYIL